MAVYRLEPDRIISLPSTSFAAQGLKERSDLQRLLKTHIDVVAPDVLIICDEFGEWEDSNRRIDLLGIDRSGKLVVIELKRDDKGGHMELQALRYAAMISRMTFRRAVQTFQSYLKANGSDADARTEIHKFIRVSEPLEDDDVLPVRIVLVAADFAKELTTAVLWLREWELDIICVKVKPYSDNGGIILEVQQVVPLPEAAEYQIAIREEAIDRREASLASGPATGYYFMNTGDITKETGRCWEDCYKYGFMAAGGGTVYQNYVKARKPGDKICAYLSGHGYVGVGEVISEAQSILEFVPAGNKQKLINLPITATPVWERWNDAEQCEWCVSVRWIHKLPREKAVLKHRSRRQTFQAINQQGFIDELLDSMKAAETGVG